MRIVLCGVLAVCAAAACAGTASGQTAATGSISGGIFGSATPSTRQPFTAKFRITNERTLANGTTITTESTEIQAEDAQGRRLHQTTNAANAEIPEHTFVQITDSAARTNTNWVAPGKTVTVRTMPPLPQRGQGRSCWSYSMVSSGPGQTETAGSVTMSSGTSLIVGRVAGAAPGTAAPIMRQGRETTREELGTETIQGLVAVGIRTTTTTPAGAVGNDEPLVRTDETWTARSIPLVVRSVIEDLRTGKRTRELVEFAQGEPDSSLFQFPEGYEVVNEEPHSIPCSQ